MAVEGMSGAPLLRIRAAPCAVRGDETEVETAAGAEDPSGLGEHTRGVVGEAERHDEDDGAEAAVRERERPAAASHHEHAA